MEPLVCLWHNARLPNRLVRGEARNHSPSTLTSSVCSRGPDASPVGKAELVERRRCSLLVANLATRIVDDRRGLRRDQPVACFPARGAPGAGLVLTQVRWRLAVGSLTRRILSPRPRRRRSQRYTRRRPGAGAATSSALSGSMPLPGMRGLAPAARWVLAPGPPRAVAQGTAGTPRRSRLPRAPGRRRS